MRFRSYDSWEGLCNGVAYNQVVSNSHSIPPTKTYSYPTAYDYPIGTHRVGEISDIVGRLGKRRPKGPDLHGLSFVHPCDHSHSVLSFHGPRELSFTQTNDSHITTAIESQGFQDRLLDQFCGLRSNNWSGIAKSYTASDFYGPDWFAIIDELEEQTYRLMPQEFFLGEFLIEYEIFADALKLLINPTSGIRSLLKLFKLLKRKPKTLYEMSSISSSAASGYLGYTFGVKPAIKDIRSILSAHLLVSARLDYLRANAGGWVPVRVRKNLPCSVSDIAFPSDWEYFTPTVRLRCPSKRTLVSAGCMGRVHRQIQPYEFWTAYSQYFGLNNVLGLAWELVPFSFVVDWFTNTQERINHLFRSRADSPYQQLRNFYFTKKTELVETAYCSPLFYYPPLSAYSDLTDWTPFATKRTVEYHRTLFVPSTSGFVDLRNLGSFQAITGGALVLQRVR